MKSLSWYNQFHFLGIVQAIRKSQVILNAHLRCALASRKIVQKELRNDLGG